MFVVGKDYRFTILGDDGKRFETRVHRVLEVNYPHITIRDPLLGEQIINTASLVFVGATEHIEVEGS
jgi:hypothetical protein